MDELKLLRVNTRIQNMKLQFNKLLARVDAFPDHPKSDVYRRKMKELIVGIKHAETNKELIIYDAAVENAEGVNISVPTKPFGLTPQAPNK